MAEATEGGHVTLGNELGPSVCFRKEQTGSGTVSLWPGVRQALDLLQPLILALRVPQLACSGVGGKFSPQPLVDRLNESVCSKNWPAGF